ncbi:MAG: CYTH domain-containing protein [Bacteroidales bacterium]|jgi:CYTH domain-containing protein|nr:CYTH domain-containing protein [Bacteroidales bacterium]MBR1434453.1 CYTH domain-containing protein [Bacteroidales bacterium]
MHIETERKFLVKDTSYKEASTESHHLVQGYICTSGGRTVRVRLYDDTGYLTIKGPSQDGLSRMEWEKEIPFEDAKDLFALCLEGIIDKTRWIVPEGNGTLKFEVDEFHGLNAGLTVAEIELPSPETEFNRPEWLGEEVTGDRRYYNSHLSKLPFMKW